MGIRIMKAGLQTSVQDLGRYGAQRYGMAVSGAMDSLALRLGNILLTNEEGEAALECTMLGPTIFFEDKQLICITGADLSPTIDGIPVPMWKPIFVAAGSLLSFGRPRSGSRAYICFQGGLNLVEVWGSRSTYLKGNIGGWKGRTLKEGDQLPFRQAYTGREEPFRWGMDSRLYPDLSTAAIRVLDGPHMTWFEDTARQRFFSESFVISKDADRMGYRLESGILRLRQQKELLSTAVTYGTVQVPPQGKPIILMADHPTTGGYPIIAQVVTVDLPLLAQRRPNEEIRFERVTLHEAHSLLQQRESQWHKLKKAIAFKYE